MVIGTKTNINKLLGIQMHDKLIFIEDVRVETKKKLLKQLGLDSLGKIASKSLNKTKKSLNKTFQDFKKKKR